VEFEADGATAAIKASISSHSAFSFTKRSRRARLVNIAGRMTEVR
jgi:hypothetical protein